jgi:hypothetical protein
MTKLSKFCSVCKHLVEANKPCPCGADEAGQIEVKQ